MKLVDLAVISDFVLAQAFLQIIQAAKAAYTKDRVAHGPIFFQVEFDADHQGVPLRFDQHRPGHAAQANSFPNGGFAGLGQDAFQFPLGLADYRFPRAPDYVFPGTIDLHETPLSVEDRQSVGGSFEDRFVQTPMVGHHSQAIVQLAFRVEHGSQLRSDPRTPYQSETQCALQRSATQLDVVLAELAQHDTVMQSGAPGQFARRPAFRCQALEDGTLALLKILAQVLGPFPGRSRGAGVLHNRIRAGQVLAVFGKDGVGKVIDSYLRRARRYHQLSNQVSQFPDIAGEIVTLKDL